MRRSRPTSAAWKNCPRSRSSCHRPPAPKRDRKSADMRSELKMAAAICGKSKEAVVSMFNEARMGRAVDSAGAQSLVEEISDSVTRNPRALISLARLKTADEYTY